MVNALVQVAASIRSLSPMLQIFANKVTDHIYEIEAVNVGFGRHLKLAVSYQAKELRRWNPN